MSKHRGLQVPQERAGDKISASKHKRRKALTIEEKLEIRKCFEKNGRTYDTNCAPGIKESETAGKMKESYLAGISATKFVRTRSEEMEEMAHLSSVWIEYQTQKQSEAAFLRIKRRS